MSQKEIDFPLKIKEYFVDLTKINKYEDIEEDFDKIKEDIKNNCLMFKDIIISDALEKVVESEKKEGFFIVTKYKEIKDIDFDNTEIKIEKLLNQEEKKLRNFPIIKTESIMEYVGEDKFKQYDIESFGIARAARNKSKFYIY